MLGHKIELSGLKGVGKVELTLDTKQRVFTLIGENGIGKTKTLEALFQILFFGNRLVGSLVYQNNRQLPNLVFSHGKSDEITFQFSHEQEFISSLHPKLPHHDLPIVFIAAQNRGLVQPNIQTVQSIGSLDKRRQNYLLHIIQQMEANFANLGGYLDISTWFVTQAQSANPYQEQADNRKIEIDTVIRLLHQIDNRIDPEFISIDGEQRVSLKISGEKRLLTQMSSGFTSILKIIQTIISGYGYFTNETALQHVKGIVLIDEIESHLHVSWQSNIIPLLKRLFPNTTFYISTHSPIVLSQLKQGEAYRLVRNSDGVVRSQEISAPNKVALVDALKEAFGIDVNQLKLERLKQEDQQAAKQDLLSLLNEMGDQ